MRRFIKILFIIFILISTIGLNSLSLLGEKTPAIRLPDINGKMHSLKDYLGKVVLIDIWASWCGPCRYYMPKNQRLHNKYAAKGLKVLAINIEGKNSNAPAYIKRNNFTFTVLYDRGNWSAPIIKKFGVTGVPFVALVDKKGIIRFTGHPANITDTLIEKALKDKFPEPNIIKLTRHILIFEKNIHWRAQNTQWKKIGRKQWLSKVMKVSGINDIKKLLSILETSLKQDAFIPDWVSKKQIWKNKLKSAENIQAISKLTIELSDSIQEHLYSVKWKMKLKKEWLNSIQNLQ